MSAESDGDEANLSERARDVLESKPKWQRPTCVEFAGTPKSGKSSCIESVAHFFRRHDYRVLAPTEGAAKRTPYYLKADLLHYNAWSACYSLMSLLDGRHSADEYHLVFLDRGPFDSLVWFDLLCREGKIGAEECRTVQDFMLIHSWRSLLDMVLLSTVDPKVSLQRENEGKLVEKHGQVMNPDFLGKLNSSYERVREAYEEQFELFLKIDTTPPDGLDRRAAAFEVVDATLALLEVT